MQPSSQFPLLRAGSFPLCRLGDIFLYSQHSSCTNSPLSRSSSSRLEHQPKTQDVASSAMKSSDLNSAHREISPFTTIHPRGPVQLRRQVIRQSRYCCFDSWQSWAHRLNEMGFTLFHLLDSLTSVKISLPPFFVSLQHPLLFF